MFELGIPWWEIVIRSTTVYFFVLIFLRMTGWRSLGQRNALDLVLILIVANAVQNAMVGDDMSLLGGFIAAGTLFIIDTVLNRVLQDHALPGIRLSGNPRVLISHGEMYQAELKRAGIGHDEMMEILREHGIDDIAKVKTAILEMDGTVSVIAEETPATYSHRRIVRPNAADRNRTRSAFG